MFQQELAFDARGRRIVFNLELDETNAHDQFMMEYFQRGMCYEAEIAWIAARVLHEGDFAIDVGANVGFFTLFMSKLVGWDGMVFAFEPAEDNLQTLERNLYLNDVTNVQVIEQPLWCKEEMVTFYLNADSRGSHALFDPGNFPDNVRSRANPNSFVTRATTLDALDISKERVKLIKIDTEGAEQKILEGASELLSKHRPPYIVSELNPHGLKQSGCDTETLRTYMRQFGYELFMIHAGDQLPALVPDKTRIKYHQDVRVMNALFSTFDKVAEAWPEIMG